MKKILLIGNPNGIIQNVFDLLSEIHRVQICEPVRNSVKSLCKIVKPDVLVIVKTSDMVDSLFREIRIDLPAVPIITVCNSDDAWINYFKGQNNIFVLKPVKKQDLLNAIEGKAPAAGKVGTAVTSESSSPDSLDATNNSTDSEAAQSNISSEITGKAVAGNAVAGRREILAIDDDPMTLRAIKGMLGDRYEVIVATSAEKGMSLIGSHNFGLILLDYEMADMDGCTAFALFKMNHMTSEIPVIFLTSVSDKKRITDVLQLKPAGYLLKPINADKLKEAVAAVLR